MNILIVSALRIEMAPFLLDGKSPDMKNTYSAGCNYFHYTGMGMDRVNRSLREFLAKYPVDCLLNIGFCGALHDDLVYGEVVQVRAVCKSHSRSKIFNMETPLKNLKSVRCCTVDSPLESALERKRLFQQKAAEIADMELYAIAGISREKELPLFSLKIISDFARGNILNQVKTGAKALSEKLYRATTELLSLLESEGAE